MYTCGSMPGTSTGNSSYGPTSAAALKPLSMRLRSMARPQHLLGGGIQRVAGVVDRARLLHVLLPTPALERKRWIVIAATGAMPIRRVLVQGLGCIHAALQRREKRYAIARMHTARCR